MAKIRFLFQAVKGQFHKEAERQTAVVGRAITAAMSDVAEGAKADLRRQIKSGFRRTPRRAKAQGQDFAQSVQAPVYPANSKGSVRSGRPRRFSLSPAAVPHVKAEFADAFEDGTTQSPSGAKWRVIALPNVSNDAVGWDRMWKGGKGHTSYRKWSDIKAAQKALGPLRLLKSKSGFVLAADKAKAKGEGIRSRRKKGDFTPLFALVKQTKSPKKIDFHATVRKWHAKLDAKFQQRLIQNAKSTK